MQSYCDVFGQEALEEVWATDCRIDAARVPVNGTRVENTSCWLASLPSPMPRCVCVFVYVFLLVSLPSPMSRRVCACVRVSGSVHAHMFARVAALVRVWG